MVVMDYGQSITNVVSNFMTLISKTTLFSSYL